MPFADREITNLFDRLRPYLDRYYRTSNIASQAAAGIQVHGLDSQYHTGQLPWSKVDKSLSSLSDLAIRNHAQLFGITANDHHNQQHELANGSGLGTDHTVTGLTPGTYLRATSPTTAAFAGVSHTDLTDVTANQHHNQVHDVVGTDHQLTGARWNVVGATNTNTIGLILPGSSTLAVAEQILKSDGAGGIYLRQFGVGTNSPAMAVEIRDTSGNQMRLSYSDTAYMDFSINAGGSWTISPTGDIIANPAGKDLRPLNNFDINLGTEFEYYLAAYIAELRAKQLVIQEVRSTIGGALYVAPTNQLTRDLAAGTVTYDTITQRGTATTNAGAGSPTLNTVTYRGSTSNTAYTTGLTVNRPTGTVNGDVLIAVVAWWISSLTPPTGWTQIGSTQTWNIGGEDVFMRAYYRVASSEPASYTWSLDVENDISVSIATYYNVDTGSVVDAQGGQVNASNTSLTAPSISPAVSADMLLFLGAAGSDNAGSATATPPAGMTERSDATSGTWVKTYIAEQLLSSAGPTGSRTAILSTSENNAGILVALTPSSSGGGNTSVSVNRPTGVVNNDVMYAAVAYTGGTLTAPAGWTQILEQLATGVTTQVYRRVASGEGSSYTWSLDSNNALAVAITAYYNVDTTTPEETSASQANASGTSLTAPTVTPTTSSSLLLFIGGIAGDIRSTAPAGMNEEADAGYTGVGIYVADESLSTADATGPNTAIMASSAVSAGVHIVLRPTSASGSAPITIYVKYNDLQNGDRVILQGVLALEAMAVTSAYTEITAGEEYSYTVTRDLDGTGPNAWVKGDAVLNTGQTGNGWLEMYAQYGLTAQGETSNQRVGPTIVGNVRQSNTWNDFKPRFAAGSLNGLYDYATTVYGFAAGNPAGSWVALDDTQGLRFMNVNTEVGYIRPNGTWRFYGDASNYISWNGTTMSVRGDILVTGAVDWENMSGSPNLVRNSSFEMDTNGDGLADSFNLYNNDGGSVPTTASIVAGSKSTRAQRISWTGTSASTKGIWFTITETKANDVDYVLSFWARTNTATSVVFYENPPGSTQTWLTSQATSTTWAYYAVRMRWPTAGGAPADNNLYLSIPIGAAISNGWIEFDNVQVTRGSERVPYTASPVDIIGYGGDINMPFQSGASGLYLTNNYLGYWNSTAGAWRSYIQSNGNAYFGNGSTQYMSWNGTSLTISGTINVVGGFTGVNYAGAASAGGAANSISGQGALATQNTADFATQVSGAQKPANNATVGATWGSNLSSIPVRFQDAPSSNGLYLTSSALGYYNSGWKSYFDDTGNFFFGYNASNRIEYNASANQLRGIGGGNVQWYASGSNGYLYAGGGAAGVSSRGVEILRSGGSLTRALQFVTAIGTGERAASIDVYTDTNPILPYYNQNTLWIETFATTGKAYHSIRMISQSIELAAGVYASSFDAGSVGGSWTALPFTGTWADYAGYQTCQYMKFGNIVFLRGLALSSGTTANIANLPSGYRPTSGQILRACMSSVGTTRVDITTAGAINVVGGATNGMWVYLDHVFFTS